MDVNVPIGYDTLAVQCMEYSALLKNDEEENILSLCREYDSKLHKRLFDILKSYFEVYGRVSAVEAYPEHKAVIISFSNLGAVQAAYLGFNNSSRTSPTCLITGKSWAYIISERSIKVHGTPSSSIEICGKCSLIWARTALPLFKGFSKAEFRVVESPDKGFPKPENDMALIAHFFSVEEAKTARNTLRSEGRIAIFT